MLRCPVIAVVVALAGTMTAIAQQKPDFSGEWQLNRQASMLSPIVAPVAQTGTLRIEHKEPNFRCQMTIVLDAKPVETKYEMLSDGREDTTWVAVDTTEQPEPSRPIPMIQSIAFALIAATSRRKQAGAGLWAQE